ncbi:MAG: hypothetical protein ACRDNM_03105 [Gaiellaceae bacterium]
MTTFVVESSSRWDALALAGRLVGYRWYMIEPDASHWDVCVLVEQRSGELPEDLRQRIEAWLRERRLGRTIIHADARDYAVSS